MHGGTGASDDVNPLLNREAEHDVWREGRNGDRLIKAILAYLVPSKVTPVHHFGLPPTDLMYFSPKITWNTV
jgi:hypothetical protein